MSIALLRRLARERFPTVLLTDPDIEAARPLIICRHIEAAMQVTFDPFGGLPRPGLVVTAITPLGYLLLACLPVEGKS